MGVFYIGKAHCGGAANWKRMHEQAKQNWWINANTLFCRGPETSQPQLYYLSSSEKYNNESILDDRDDLVNNDKEGDRDRIDVNT